MARRRGHGSVGFVKKSQIVRTSSHVKGAAKHGGRKKR